MKSFLISLLIITLVRSQIQCEWTFYENQYFKECLERDGQCSIFDSLELAQKECVQIRECSSVTKIQGQYRLNTSNTIYKANPEEDIQSWFRAKCRDQKSFEACYGGKSSKQEISGCSKGCQDYADQDEALKQCTKEPTCGGITYSHMRNGGENSSGPLNGWGFQLRLNNQLQPSKDEQEYSFLKTTCNDTNTRCDYKVSRNSYLEGCVDECKDYQQLIWAQAACDRNPECSGITFTTKQRGGANSTGNSKNDYGYQLRKSSQPILIGLGQTYETSYVKKQKCEKENRNYTWASARSDTYLAECINGCKDYDKLIDALAACLDIKECGGVTFSTTILGGKSSTGPVIETSEGKWGYQLRIGSQYQKSESKEISWLKLEIGQESQEKIQSCYYQKNQSSLQNCVNDCEDFQNFDTASTQCTRLKDQCQGVVYASVSQGGSKSQGIADNGYGYQLRTGWQFQLSNDKQSKAWLKGPCGIQINNRCDWIQEINVEYENCIDSCQIYKSLAEAQQLCDKNTQCQAISFVIDQKGYQLRQNMQGQPVKRLAASWVKAKCPLQINNEYVQYFWSAAQYGITLEECFQDCREFDLLEEAMLACNPEEGCGGITYTFSRNDIKKWVYQLRVSSVFTISSIYGEISWVKYRIQKKNDTTDKICYSEKESIGYALNSCASLCKNYDNLEDAINFCNQDKNCRGITYSKKKGGIGSTLDEGYQLRGGFAKQSSTEDKTWVQIDCPKNKEEVIQHETEITIETQKEGYFDEDEGDQRISATDRHNFDKTIEDYHTPSPQTPPEPQTPPQPQTKTTPSNSTTLAQTISTPTFKPPTPLTPSLSPSTVESCSTETIYIDPKTSETKTQTTTGPVISSQTISTPTFKQPSPVASSTTLITINTPTPVEPQTDDSTVTTPIITERTPIPTSTPPPTVITPVISNPTTQVDTKKTVTFKTPDRSEPTIPIDPVIPIVPVNPVDPHDKECKVSCVYFYTECEFQGDRLEVCKSIPKQKKVVYKSVKVPQNVHVKIYSNEYYNQNEVGTDKLITESVNCKEEGFFFFSLLQQSQSIDNDMSISIEFIEKKQNLKKQQYI